MSPLHRSVIYYLPCMAGTTCRHVVVTCLDRRNPNKHSVSNMTGFYCCRTTGSALSSAASVVCHSTYLVSASYICNLKKAANLKEKPYQAIKIKSYLGEKEVPQPQPLSAFGLSITCKEF